MGTFFADNSCGIDWCNSKWCQWSIRTFPQHQGLRCCFGGPCGSCLERRVFWWLLPLADWHWRSQTLWNCHRGNSRNTESLALVFGFLERQLVLNYLLWKVTLFFFQWADMFSCTSPRLHILRMARRHFRAETGPNKPRPREAGQIRCLSLGLRADNTTMSDTSPPPLHLGHPALVSLLLVRVCQLNKR